MKNFNSRPSARGDPIRTHVQRSGFVFQFTPLREGRRLPHHWHSQRGNISIHAPPRGATTDDRNVPAELLDISIHAPPRGATRALDYYKKNAEKFQFTPLREGRLFMAINSKARHDISIHAPPRGATVGGYRVFGRHNFNSRPSARGDNSMKCHAWLPIFQFTPLREGRPIKSACLPVMDDFNSRPSARGDAGCVGADGRQPFQFTPLREGRPQFVRKCRLPRYISIHAPPRGATKLIDALKGEYGISIHAPPRGATFGRVTLKPTSSQFQFTPLREGRQYGRTVAASAAIFQFTPLREGRQKSLQKISKKCDYFNSRPSARGDPRPVVQHFHHDAISIHAPPRGATQCPYQAQRSCLFQFTPLREGRPSSRPAPAGSHNFNSRPSARGDPR